MNETTTGTLHYYLVEEGGCVRHWAVARDEAEAIRVVRDTADVEDDEELEASQYPDDEPHPVTFVDGFDCPERWQEEVPPGAEVHFITEFLAKVTVTAGDWACWYGMPSYAGCSEY